MLMAFSPATPSHRPKVRPRVERLEDRDCPAAPTINNFTVTPLYGTTVQVTGTVADENPQMVMVNLGGKMMGTITPQANGSFSYTAQAMGLGTVTAQALDWMEGLSSSTVSGTIASNVPSLTLNISYGTGNTVTLTGTVTDETPGGRMVMFGGKVVMSTMTNGDGTFSWTGAANGPGSGMTITAQTTDSWGQQSQQASVTIANNAPVIEDFEASEGLGGYWTFTGHVIDESAPNLQVKLNGLMSLTNVNVTVNGDGWFSYVVLLLQTESGTATAKVKDSWGIDSEIATTLVRS